jgi:hypothetical protein
LSKRARCRGAPVQGFASAEREPRVRKVFRPTLYMKIPITLAVLQTIGVVVLIVHAFGNEEQIDAAILRPPPKCDQVERVMLRGDEASLRNVIREELARLQGQSLERTRPAATGRARKQSDDRLSQELAQQVEAYRAMGAITDEQMQELQAGIAQLDEASRKGLMSKLIQALNSGELKGRL